VEFHWRNLNKLKMNLSIFWILLKTLFFYVQLIPFGIKFIWNYYFDKSISKNIQYSNKSQRNTLDIYKSTEKNSKLLIFYHGGAWKSGTKLFYYNLAKTFQQQNITTIMVNFRLYPEVEMN
jgi:acetyl esterase/lipase